jgi:hypothetical protein
MQETNSAASTGSLPQQGQRSRILRLKSSAKGPSNTGTQNVWNRIEAVAASRPMASTSSSVPQRLGAMNLNPPTRPNVSWGSSSGPTAPAPPLPQKPLVHKPGVSPRNTFEEFPSLPTARPREKVVLNAAAGPARPVASWASDNQPANSLPQNNASGSNESSKGKGKKKGKQILFHVG